MLLTAAGSSNMRTINNDSVVFLLSLLSTRYFSWQWQPASFWSPGSTYNLQATITSPPHGHWLVIFGLHRVLSWIVHAWKSAWILRSESPNKYRLRSNSLEWRWHNGFWAEAEVCSLKPGVFDRCQCIFTHCQRHYKVAVTLHPKVKRYIVPSCMEVTACALHEAAS